MCEPIGLFEIIIGIASAFFILYAVGAAVVRLMAGKSSGGKNQAHLAAGRSPESEDNPDWIYDSGPGYRGLDESVYTVLLISGIVVFAAFAIICS